MSIPEPRELAGPRDAYRLADGEPTRQGTTHLTPVSEQDDTRSVQPTTAWSELGFDQAIATRCALYGWTAHRVSEYLCRDHGNDDPFDIILNGCDPLEALNGDHNRESADGTEAT